MSAPGHAALSQVGVRRRRVHGKIGVHRRRFAIGLPDADMAPRRGASRRSDNAHSRRQPPLLPASFHPPMEPEMPLPLLLPIRPVTSAVVAVSVASGLAAGLAAGGLLLVAAAMARRA